MAAYREDERLRLRVEELEQELAEARRTIERLEGRPSGDGGLLRRVIGMPSELVAERSAEGALDDDTVEAVVDALATRYGVEGNVTRVGRRLTWSALIGGNRVVELTIAERNGRVRLRARERLGGLIGGLYGGIGGGVGGGFTILPVFASMYLGLNPAIAVVAWIVAVLGATRALAARISTRREAQLEAAADEVARLLATTARARVAPAADEPRLASRDLQATAEADAEAEQTDAARAATGRAR